MKIAIVGAGSVGCYVGAALAANGHDIAFLGREPKGEILVASGITCISLNGEARGPISPRWVSAAQDLPPCDLYLVCVKSQDTRETAISLGKFIPDGAAVVSLQNGLENKDVLRSVLRKTNLVFSAVVVFNVVESPFGTFQATTEGGIYLPKNSRLTELKDALIAGGIETTTHEDIAAVAYAKLLLNLNNALNALSGLPLAKQLRDRAWRLVLAAMMDEGIAIAKMRGQHLPQIGKVKPTLIPSILRLPNFLFTRIASAMLKIDPAARSSMADDLKLGRGSEIEYLNSALVALGASVDVPTPVNRRVTKAVHQLFAGEKTVPTPQELLRG